MAVPPPHQQIVSGDDHKGARHSRGEDKMGSRKPLSRDILRDTEGGTLERKR